jgi:O-antigen ligase
MQVYFFNVLLFLLISIYFYLQMFLNFLPEPPWLQYIGASAQLFLCIIRPKLGFAGLVFLLPLVSNLDQHLPHLMMVPLFCTNTLVYDLGLASLAGLSLRERILNKKANTSLGTSPLILLLYIYQGWLCISLVIAISHNLHVSASAFSLKGAMVNLANLSRLGWVHDYNCLRAFISASLGIQLGLISIRLFTKSRDSGFYLIIPLMLSSAVQLIYACASNYSTLGFYQMDPYFGVNGLFSDVHVLASFGMAICFSCLFYLLFIQSKKFLAGGFVLISWITIYLSGSRSAMVLSIVLNLVVILIALKEKKVLARHRMLLTVVLLVAAIILLGFNPRVRRIDFNLVCNGIGDFSYFDRIFSLRPGIFLGAVQMSAAFPLLGIGIGNFFRYSGIEAFSHSALLVSQGGENAHNIFLQILVEQGGIGLGLFLLIVGTALWGRQREKQGLLFGGFIFGMLLSNVLAHSLLVPAMMVLFFIAVAMMEGVQRTREANFILARMRALLRLTRARLIAGLALSLLGGAAIWELSNSFAVTPFEYGRDCFLSMQDSDGFIGGDYKTELVRTGNNLQVSYVPEHSDIKRRPLQVNIKISKKEILLKEEVVVVHDNIRQVITLDLKRLGIKKNQRFVLEVISSRCFVPLNLGTNLDPRHLGVRLIGLKQN